jgi:hypothetical protein
MIKALNKKHLFSKDFGRYLTSQRDTLRAEIKQIKEERIQRQEEERIQREKAREEARIQREKEEQERIKRQEEEQIKREAEKQKRIKRKEAARIKRENEKKEKKHKEIKAFNIVSNKAAKLGYKKVIKVGIAAFLYKVKHGTNNLEDGLKALLWSKPGSADERLDKKFTVSQVLEDALIYDLSEFDGDELVQFTIIVPKKQGKLYLEGQVLLGEFFTYTGNFTYTTVFGANKTVPVFKIVEIADAP